MEEVVGSAVFEIGKCACTPLKEHVAYLTHFNDNVNNMKDRVRDLVARRELIDRLVSPDHSNGEDETPEARLWLTRADVMKQTAAMIEQKVAENKGCLHCLNLRWHYSISKQAKQMTESIARHCDDGNPDKIKLTMPLPAPTIIPQDAPSIEGFPSVKSSLEKVKTALDDEKIKIIGVWGMGGVGKTALVDNVNNMLKGTQFKKVIKVTVSKDVDIRKVQDCIADGLGLTLQNESLRESDIRSRLMKERPFVIILDDLWQRLDLAHVGIPSTNDDLKGCKIIFTTRYEGLCGAMQSYSMIEVSVLSDNESWKLFREKAGDVVDDLDLNETAMKVSKECGGLPLAIITLGSALRTATNPSVWNHALTQLKESAPSDIEGMEGSVYQSIRISYDLSPPVLRPVFLFCCLFPEDYDIHVDGMIRLWMGEGLLEDDDQSLIETINRGRTWVEQLKSSSLLLAGKEEGYVKMHDVVRDVAIWISSNECNDYKSFVRIEKEGLPRGKNWEEYKRISLMRSGINKLPEGMHCSQLLTLMMSENKKLTEIQGWFFEATKGLRVLDLTNTAISKIPLSNLMYLRVLCLRDCQFIEGNCLSAVGRLKQLEFLDLSFNKWLRELPNEIGELVNLRSLDLTETSSGNAFLSEVASLKELYYLHLDIVGVERFPRDYPLIFKHVTKMRNFYFRIWARDYDRDNYLDRQNRDDVKYMEFVGCSLIPEWAIMLLPKATHLRLKDCKGQEALNAGGGFPSLEELIIEKCDDVQFVVSVKESPEDVFCCLRSLKLRGLRNLKKVVTKDEEGLSPRLLLRNLKKVQVEECPELKHLLPSYLLQGMDNLTLVQVEDCEGMDYVFDGLPTMVQRNDVLSKLKTLYLSDLKRMTSIWPVGLVVKLENLTTLTVSKCHGLKNVLKQIKDGLPNLVHLLVHECKGVEEIISDVEDNEGLLPKLRILQLTDLPKLVRICGGEAAPLLQLDRHSLEDIRVLRCGGNEHVIDGPFNNVLLKLKTSNLNNLQNLTQLMLFRCHFFKKTVMSSVQINGGLPNLVILIVDDCRGVEEIISDVVDNEGLLPKLEVLVLCFLPELVRIYGGGEDTVQPPQLDWHSLKEIRVYKCPKLKKLQPLQRGAHSVPLLQKIEGETEWWEGLDWDGDAALSSQFHFKEVTEMNVYYGMEHMKLRWMILIDDD